MSFVNADKLYREYLRTDGVVGELPSERVLYMPEDTNVDVDLIENLISDHKVEMARVSLLEDYYRGYAAIYNRVRENPDKPNNRLVAPYPSYITDVLVGMHIGEPPTYSIAEDKEEDLELIQEVFNLNDEQDENFEIAKYCSKSGRGYEIVYIDDESKIRFNELDPKEVIFVYDDNINPKPLFAIYFIETIKGRVVHLYERDTIRKFEGTPLVEVDSKPNAIGKVPILECLNNTEILGDYERVLPLIDAYNKSISDTANDFEEFTDAILILFGMLNADDKDIKQLKEDRIILAGEGQNAEWLTKVMNTEALENHKDRLDDDIHRFTKIPNLTDEKFGGNSSGVALKYKLLALNQAISSKQRKFKRFLQGRLEIIIDYMKFLYEDIDIEHWDIEITFNPNIPIDEKANVEMVEKLMDITSESTALSQLFFIKNANEEMEKKRQEVDAYSPSMKQLLDLIEVDDEDELEE